MQRKQRRFVTGALVWVCVLLALLLALNLLVTLAEDRFGWRQDLSFNHVTTTGETTARVLDGLTQPVHIYALYARGAEDLPLLELLGRYAAASPLVTWEQTDLSLNPGLVTRFGDGESISADSLIVTCEATGRHKVLPPASFISWSFDEASGGYVPSGYTYERAVTAAIDYVTRERVPRAMILQGHGELDETATAALAELLSAGNYDVAWFNLQSEEAALTPDDLLLVLSPRRDLTNDELAQVSAFIQGGGALFITCDITDPISDMPNWLAVLRSFGFVPREGIVVADSAERGTYYNNTRTYLIPVMQRTDITADLVAARTDTLLLLGCRGFDLPGESDRALTTQALLTTTDRAWLRSLTDGKNTLDRQSADPLGPFALALQAERVTASGDVSRAVILGCSGLLTSQEVYAMTDTERFLRQVMAWLVSVEPLELGISARVAIRPQLTALPVWTGIALAVALPVAIAAAGLVVLRLRRLRSGRSGEKHGLSS